MKTNYSEQVNGNRAQDPLNGALDTFGAIWRQIFGKFELSCVTQSFSLDFFHKSKGRTKYINKFPESLKVFIVFCFLFLLLCLVNKSKCWCAIEISHRINLGRMRDPSPKQTKNK